MKLEVTCRSQSIMKGVIEVTEEEYEKLVNHDECISDDFGFIEESFLNAGGNPEGCYEIISRVNGVKNVESFDNYIENVEFKKYE